MITISTTNNGSVKVKSSTNVTTGVSLETPIKYTTHFRGEIEFKNG